MTDLVVETRGLRKVYRDQGRRIVAVDDLDLAVERGTVHGFLGPNGSGKTTTIRMLLGLARPDAGTISVLGNDFPAGIPAALGRVGALLDRGQFSSDLTGRRNLELLARAAGLPTARVDEVLDEVGLVEEGRRGYRGYSLGTRRRLALAGALLKKPALVILDEPSNGLDPAGIRDMRETIPRLAAAGVDVLLSSHILAEVQQVCTSVSILSEGRLLRTGRVRDLIGEKAARTRVGVTDPDRATSVLLAGGFEVTREGAFLVVEGHEHPDAVTRTLAEAGLYPYEISAIRPTLESFFLQLTGHRPAVPADPAERAADEIAQMVAEPSVLQDAPGAAEQDPS
ncbi:ABC-type multidrug transport system ATPase subunit [Marmoricola sp. OAE513]|uniref:ABC transporter ATP-binding protein n=1 Tax=Marmoricola sp. OAE513 TaxID=2817894 RepID=UPI001AE6BA89